VKTQRILIVEDERIVALNLQQRLVKLGYDVVGRAASGAEALAKARETQPDLVLMDIHIEGPIDGIDTAARLIDELQLRVIYLTAYSEDTTLERARATQPYGYLLKPFSERELHATLQMALERRASDLALLESEERGRLALESASMGSWEFAPGRSELRTYGLATELLGAERASDAVGLDALLACVHDEDRELAKSAVELAIQMNMPCSIEFRQQRPGRPLRWVRVVARVFRAGPAAELRLIGVAQDVTERHANESRLRQAATVFDETREGLFILDGQRRLTNANRAFALMTGIESERWAGRELPFLGEKMMPASAHTELWATLERESCWQGELRATRPGGELFPARLSLSAVRGGPGESLQMVGILSDFTELRSAQDALRQLAHYDPLTGLPNRLLMQDRLEQALSRARRCATRVAVMFLDLDHFKRINDTRGHATGDLVLREVATRLQGIVRSDDTAARLGGDEFVVILENFPDSAHVITVAEKLRHELQRPVTVGGQSFEIGTSIGIAMFPDDGQNVEQLLQGADTAMYEAKSGGRNAYAFYDRGMTVKVARYLARDQRLRRALSAGELRLHYQPQVDAKSGHCHAVEALLRWQHPELGLLGAADIVPAAEDSGLILDIGRWALHEACRQAQRWSRAGHPPIRVAVNASALQMQAGRLAVDVDDALRESGLDPRQLEVEITESSLQTESLAVATLARIRECGVSVAIDDFGTGYSCLSSLKNLPLDRLKIDRSFVQGLGADEHSGTLAETILAIASSMRLKVTAEGVETRAQSNFLCERGCEELQGWLFSPAVEAANIPALIRRWAQAA
jgi:diguanylate cyclase (GGDEF)-like protein/PAS domain S-box-containing protein